MNKLSVIDPRIIFYLLGPPAGVHYTGGTHKHTLMHTTHRWAHWHGQIDNAEVNTVNVLWVLIIEKKINIGKQL